MRSCLSLMLLLCAAANVAVADHYADGILPYVKTYCVECHNSKVHKGELDLTRYKNDADVAAHFRRWNNITEFIHNGEMPPEDAKQPSIDESNAVVAVVETILLAEAVKHAGDPGVVLPRRLSNTEYDTAIRDLTGVDIRPTRDFPADPAGGEGFDNTGEALRTSPNLVQKYLAAAQLVADHLVLKPGGISFAPFPVTSYNERKKLTELAIIDFYENHDVDTAEYLEAAWRYRYRGDNHRGLTVEEWAEARDLAGRTSLSVADTKQAGTTDRDVRPTEKRLSAKYLALMWQTVSEASSGSGFLKQLGEKWNALPAPTDDRNRPAEFRELVDFVAAGRQVLGAPEQQLIKAGAGNWPISHLDFRAKVAASRDQFDPGSRKSETLLKVTKVAAPKAETSAEAFSVFVRIDPAFADGDNYVIVKRPSFSLIDRLPNNDKEREQHQVQTLRSVLELSNPDFMEQLGFGKHPIGGDIDPDSFVVKAPAVIEIPLTVEMQRELDGKHLLMSCQLDPEHSREGSVFVNLVERTSSPPGNGNATDLEATDLEVRPTGQPASATQLNRNTQHLMYGGSETAKNVAADLAPFCNTFPNRFFYVDRVRGLAAGFHLVEGFFRDDLPLVQKVLTDDETAELNRLWDELEFVTQSTETLLRGFVWFERSEREVLHDKRFDFLRAEDPELVEDSMLTKFEKLYLDKMGVKRVDDTLKAVSPNDKYRMIHAFFEDVRTGLARQQELLAQAEEFALKDIYVFARRAFRRPLRAEERESFSVLYGKLRNDGQTVEESIRGVLIAVLMSPDFCYHRMARATGSDVHALNDHDLANRLSFFLWSSVPDEELLAAAEAGELQNEGVLVGHCRRMLRDDRIEAFAREFFGQWLRYRDYLAKDPINAEAFPGYTDDVREAIFEEPVRLATHLIQTDRAVTDLLTSDMTFVNEALAKHYGGAIEEAYGRSSGDWRPVSGLQDAGRGGLFGMAVVLTKNSAGERTSPVKRGFWSVHHLLGQHFPPPPADVPELPSSEKTATATIRELLKAHVADTQCAMCHSHFDGLGLAMEGFDAIGRPRTKDRAGRPIDNVVTLPDGKTAKGIPGLIQYIDQHRRQDFVKTLCRKFLGYALGRSVMLSDQPLLTEMEEALQENEFKFSVLFETVLRSPQFRKQRGQEFVTER